MSKDMASESGEVILRCLRIPMILERILQHFPTSELMQLSLVNKLWNREARSLMRNQGSVTARINGNDTCQDLRAFALNLQRMKTTKRVVPISGLSVALGGYRWSHGDWCKESSAAELDQAYEDILDAIRWKHLAVNFPWKWDQCKNCPAFLLVKKILDRRSSALEELSFCLENKREFTQQIIQDRSFPSLKTARLVRGGPRCRPRTSRSDATFFVKRLASVAPNLQVLYTEECVDLNANLLEGRSAVHITDYEYSPSLDEIPGSVLDQLRMQRMKLESICEQFSLERFNSITSELLQTSCKTLSSMKIAAIFLIPLTSYRICLPSVRMLRVIFTEAGLEVFQPRLWRLLKSFDFKRIFPNLSTVHISWMSSFDFEPILNAFDGMIEQANATFIKPMPDRAGNINSLNLQWVLGGILESSIGFLVHMFPHVQKLSVRAENMRSPHIWESWVDLEELAFSLRGRRVAENFDGAFCGIFPEEVAQLQEQDEEYLRRVNIVPVRPSIACLKGLRTFRLSFGEFPPFHRQIDDPTSVFSKVTGLTVFRRWPTLAVTVAPNNENRRAALSHLTPHATVVLSGLAR